MTSTETTLHQAAQGAISWQALGPVRDVGIIGAGAAGIVSAKVLMQAGFNVTVYEAGSTIGGLWVYDNDNGQSIAYRNLYILSPKRYTQFRDFPFDQKTPEYAHHTDMSRYLRQYAEFFDVIPRIRFNDRVVGIAKRDGRWEVASATGASKSFDAVLVATGHFHVPRWPRLAGSFSGELLHSSQYRDPLQLANKRVLVVGIGNSACDVAVDASWVATKTTISTRTGILSGPKWLFGHSPFDLYYRVLGVHVPKSLPGRILKPLVRLQWGDRATWGFRDPEGKGAHGTLNEFLFSIVKYGRITLRPDVAAIDGQVIRFIDGTEEEFDVIVAGTGYELSFPFLDGLIDLDAERSEVDDLYLRIFAIKHPGMSFVGLANSNLGTNTPNFERQAELIADVLGGQVVLPTSEEMTRAVAERRERTRQQWLNTPRHALEERHPDYMIELERERRLRRRNASANGQVASAERFGKRCWVCGRLAPADTLLSRYATDWWALRSRGGAYTRPVRVCRDCWHRVRMGQLRIAAAALAVILITALVVFGLVSLILHFV
jgi:dimethylaniline monooxygenase (N-oxide forming)